MSDPRPQDVTDALAAGRAPSELVDETPAAAPATGAPAEARTAGGGVEVVVRGGALVAAQESALQALRADDVATRLVQKDATLWGPEAAGEAAVRLGWLDAVDQAGGTVQRVTALREELAAEGVDRVVLGGMGGSSLAPEVVCATAGVPLVVLDTTDPAQVRSALVELERTVVVVSSKSGGTVETDSHRRAARAAFEAAGIDPARRVVVVTDPGSPLAETAEAEGVRALFLADPDVGGRYSALTAFGLVPSGLAGADVQALVDAAAAVQPTLADPDGPALALGAVLGGAAAAGHDKLVLPPSPDTTGLPDWAEQLVAESTGKQGRGVLPVVVESPDAPGTAPAADLHLTGPAGTQVTGPLGAQFLLWEFATAVAGRVLRIDPFDQPDVESAKASARELLEGDAPDATRPLFTESGVEVHATGDLLAEVDTLQGALDALLSAVPDRGYLAVMAYLDRLGEARAAGLRPALARRTAHPVTFGWGPRFLHSTGQFHKGGPAVGVFLQVTAEVGEDLEIPGRPFTFGRLQAAQAAGDLRVLADAGRPVLRLHLVDREAGLSALLRAAGAQEDGA